MSEIYKDFNIFINLEVIKIFHFKYSYFNVYREIFIEDILCNDPYYTYTLKN